MIVNLSNYSEVTEAREVAFLFEDIDLNQHTRTLVSKVSIV